MRITGWLAIGAGVTFFAADVYLFAVLGAAGWNIDMFDDPTALLPWLAGHQRLYQGLWLMYFVSQALLLVVPWRLGEQLNDRATGLLGTVSVALAIVGVAMFLAAAPVVADAYAGGVDVLPLHNVTADFGKDLRLLSEVLLGAWLLLVGRRLAATSGRRGWWALAAIGGWTLLVAAWKLLDPELPLEDWLAFLLGGAYVVLGFALIRSARPRP
ncbi:hypothetical protein GCM10009682_19840 [Luedemannella flava]|uniref:DUF4386 family protein n=1 Tax=Luedemannella flava TaxID=349316 RepID=A0ABP4XYH0_9ACTN